MKLTVYHGSDEIVQNPLYGVGKEDNDYGSGFYTTEDVEKAKEWACTNCASDKAVRNKYSLDLTDLNVLNLNEYGMLAWIAEVASHRGARSEITKQLAELLVAKYKIDTSNADVIVGYRADDSYIDFVEAFLNNQISIDELSRQFQKGDLGEQVFIKSPKAFKAISFESFEEVNPQTINNFGDAKARSEVHNFLKNRAYAIQVEGFSPVGITARVAINNDFEFSKEYKCYLPIEPLKNEKQKTAKGKKDYDDE